MRKLIFIVGLIISSICIAEPIELKVMKDALIKLCGEEDEECVEAVENQFYDCHKKAEKEWDAYTKASMFNDEKELDAYDYAMIKCIKYADGEQIFISK